ncbi:MAG: response regulator [Chloroflexi bacterium]|nr:response regulator [Chloroflexota bacterium]
MRPVGDRVLTEMDGLNPDLVELRGEAIRALTVATLLVGVGALALGAVDPLSRATELWIVVLCLAVTALAGHLALRRSHVLATLSLGAGLVLSLRIAVWLYPDSQLVYLLPLVVMILVLLLGPRYGSLAALLASGLVLVAQGEIPGAVWGGVTGTVLALIWGSAVLCWLATRPTQVALGWSWHSYVQALQRTEELRDRQGELGRLSKSLTETCVRLEQMNVELERARRAAEEARRLKAEFAAAISHELRTPLNLIIGFSELMATARHTYAGEVLPESYRADVEAIYRNACHISNLIDDVLDLSRIEAHRMALQRERAALPPIVDEAVATIANLARERGLSLRTNLHTALPPLTIDRTRIKQILINLLNNAIRSTARGEVTVEATLKDSEVVVSVCDTGVGVALEDLPQLFQEYSQIGGSSRRGRSGLGLAVSKQFAELHGGTMWAESQPGQGSTFYLSLPLCDAVVASPFESGPDALALATSDVARKTVAVVGQDAEAARTFQRYLDGYRVVCAADSSTVARDGQSLPQAVVLTDQHSVEAWRAVQAARPPSRQVPLLTCSLSTTWARIEEMGVAGYLVKPVTRDQLAAALSRLGLGKGSHRLLVVEDDAEMGRLLAKMVRSLSRRHRVRWARNGAEGLALAREDRPDAVLLDLLMPEVDGYEVLRTMRSDGELREVPVVIVTARGREEEPVLATALSITRPGGLTVGEVMGCAKGALDCLLSAPSRGSAPALPAAPAG